MEGLRFLGNTDYTAELYNSYRETGTLKTPQFHKSQQNQIEMRWLFVELWSEINGKRIVNNNLVEYLYITICSVGCKFVNRASYVRTYVFHDVIESPPHPLPKESERRPRHSQHLWRYCFWKPSIVYVSVFCNDFKKHKLFAQNFSEWMTLRKDIFDGRVELLITSKAITNWAKHK